MGGGEYRLVFPHDDDTTAVGYGWEFDRTHSLFVTVNNAGRLLIELNEKPPCRCLLPSFVPLHRPHKLDESSDEADEDGGLANAVGRLQLSDESSTPPQQTRDVLPEDPSRRGPSFFRRLEDGSLALYRPNTILQVPVENPYKAFAELDRGPNHPLVRAMSGYTYADWPDVLDNYLWARRADHLRIYLELR